MHRMVLLIIPLFVGATGIALRMGIVGGLPPTCC